MEQLHEWLGAQFALQQVEQNSGLGKAITYLFASLERADRVFYEKPAQILRLNFRLHGGQHSPNEWPG